MFTRGLLRLDGKFILFVNYMSNMPTVEYLNYDVLEENEWSLEDEEVFEKASEAELDEEDYGRLEVDEEGSILDAAEDAGYDWPYGCRQGMCASCTSVVVSGDIDISGQQVLSDDEVDDGARVTCIGTPDSDELQIVYNAEQHL